MRYFYPAVLFLAASVLPAQTPAPKPEATTPVKPPPAAAPAESPDKVVLSVGDEKMTAGQFQEFVNSLPDQYRSPRLSRAHAYAPPPEECTAESMVPPESSEGR